MSAYPKVTSEVSKKNHVMEFSSEEGQYRICTYQIFPGIEFIFKEIHIQKIERQENIAENILEISYCKEGRLEYHSDDEFWYLAAGDLSITQTKHLSSSVYFPLCHYHGITIRMDLDKTPYCLSCFLNDVEIQPKDIAEKFCKGNQGFVIRANPSFEHIFFELYHVPSTSQKAYFKIKTLELLLYLRDLDTHKNDLSHQTYTRSQVFLARKISDYMIRHMDQQLTLEDLSKEFHVSAVHIKKVMKGVYGVSVGSYIRMQKMESAAYMLEHTNKSILEIANLHGYSNGSKFANAFRSIKGMNPTEYRDLKWK